MYWLGGVLCLGIILWIISPGLEWSVPHKWQSSLRTWLNKCRCKTEVLNYVCYLSSEGSELEKDLLNLRVDLRRKRQKSKIKVRVKRGMATRQKEIFIACLQRRFPEIEIYEDAH